jgi:hypothetical protein
MNVAMEAGAAVSASAWDRSPVCSRTGSTSARSPTGARCIRGEHEPLLTRDLFEAVQAKARRQRRRPAHGRCRPSDRPPLRRPRQPHEPDACEQARCATGTALPVPMCRRRFCRIARPGQAASPELRCQRAPAIKHRRRATPGAGFLGEAEPTRPAPY